MKGLCIATHTYNNYTTLFQRSLKNHNIKQNIVQL